MADLVREIHHPAASELDLPTVLRVVGDPVRLRIVRELAARGDAEMTCGEISDLVGLPTSTCSYHLRLLREAGVTRARPAGTERRMRLRHDELEERFPGLVEVLVGAG
jgi:DNA-binding transcriptional ArsR family regulator